jgi:hypothetical protein
VYQRLAVLSSPAAGEDPDAALAHYRSYERRAERLHVQRTAVFAIGIAAVLVLVAPASRGVARQSLDRFYMRSPEAVRANYISIGTANALHKEYAAPPAAPRFVFDMANAREQAGFDPRLRATLQEQLNSGLAVLKRSDPFNMRIKIHADDLMSAF